MEPHPRLSNNMTGPFRDSIRLLIDGELKYNSKLDV